jgi:hypothetical protein
MAPTVVATAKDPNANSYCDEDFAADYFDGRLNAGAWSADPALQPTALVMATMRLEQEKYKGTRSTQTQALKFPRIGVTDDDGVALNPDVVPVDVKRATCELALAMLAAGTGDITAGTGLEQFKSLAVSSIRLDLRDPIASKSDAPGLYPVVPGDPANTIAVNRYQLPFQVQRLLRSFLVTDIPKSAQGTAGFGTVRLSRS